MRDAPQLLLNHDLLDEGLQAQWLNPRNAEWQEAAPTEEGYYQSPSSDFWLLVLQPAE